MSLRTILTRTTAVLLVVVFLVYGFIEARGLVLGPTVRLDSPLEGYATDSPLLILKGQAVRAKDLQVNGRKVLLDLSGNFGEYMTLAPGENIMTIIATDARGKQKTLVRHLYLHTQSTGKPNDSSAYDIIPTVDATGTSGNTATDTGTTTN